MREAVVGCRHELWQGLLKSDQRAVLSHRRHQLHFLDVFGVTVLAE